MKFNLIKLLVILSVAGFLTACKNNPTKGDVTDIVQEDRRSGDGLLEPRDDKNVEVLSMDDDIAGAVDILSGAYADGLLGDEMIDGIFPVVYFGYDQATIDEASMKVIKFYAARLIDNPGLSVVLEGHTDERGTPSYNLALGEKRAKSVSEVLILHGVSAARITEISFGEEQPAEVGHDESAWSKNRRVEIKVE